MHGRVGSEDGGEVLMQLREDEEEEDWGDPVDEKLTEGGQATQGNAAPQAYHNITPPWKRTGDGALSSRALLILQSSSACNPCDGERVVSKVLVLCQCTL